MRFGSYFNHLTHQQQPQKFIFVLELEQNKYWIGSTRKNVDAQISKYMKGKGSAFAQRYPPIRTIEVRPGYPGISESLVTLEYMKNKGIRNVRGGIFNNIHLTSSQIQKIQHWLELIYKEMFRSCSCGHVPKY